MRRLLAPVVAVLLTLGFLTSAPLASAAPPAATWTGSAGGDTASVDLNVIAGLQLEQARLADSQADSGSQRTPRSTARSANLGVAVATLPISVLSNTQNAGPTAGTNTSNAGIAASSALGVSVGALQTSDTARWNGDNACVTGDPLAESSTQTAGVSVNPLAVAPLLSTDVSRTTGTTELVANGTGSFNNGVRSTATGTIAGVTVLGLGIGVAGTSTLRTTATGSAGGASYDYNPGTVTITNGGTTRTVALGATENVTLSLAGALTARIGVTANRPATSLSSAGTSATATVSVVSVTVSVTSIAGTVLTSSIDLLPLRASSTVPSGGIDCPAPAPAAPVVLQPADGSRTNSTTPTYSGTGVAGATVNLTVDGTRTASVTTVGSDGTWSYRPTTALAAGAHTVSATQTRFGTESAASNQNRFTVDLTAPDAPVLNRPANGTVTNDRTPTCTGTAEPGSSVTVYEGGTALGTGTADGSGAFSIVSSQLGAGSHTVRARATDEAGNTSADSDATTFTIDLTAPAAPVLTSPADGSTTTDTTPTVVGTAEPGATVRVRVDGDSIGTATAGSDGRFEVTPTASLGQGAHTATAVATDPAGNDSSTSGTLRFTIDSVAPDAPVVRVPADGSSTADTTPTISGTAEAGASVAVSVDGTAVGTVTADGDGRFEVTPATPLAEGPHSVTAVATDAVGNVSATSSPVRFTVDTVVPAAPVLASPANGAVVADRSPTYTGTAEPGAQVTVYEGTTALGTGQADGTGAFSIASSSLAEGPHTVVARAADAAGNVSPDSNGATFVVDVTAPASPVVTAPVDGSTTNDATPTITGTAEPDVSVEVFLDGTSVGTVGSDGTGAWSFDAPTLGEGPHTVTARATDAAGNVSDPSAEVGFTVDSVAPPTPEITVPADGSVTGDATPTISGTAEAGASVEVFVDGASVGTATADGDGRFAVTPTAPLTDDLHTATAVATDAAANGSEASAPVTFRVDTAAPAAPVVTVPADGSSTADTTPTVRGTAEAGADVEVFVDGTSVGTTTADDDGAFELTPTDALDEGPHVVRAVATDAGGNASVPSDAVTFDVDTSTPDAPVITTPADGSTTADPTPAISGTAEPGASVEVVVDGTSVGTAVADGTGAYAVTPGTPLADGPHTATAVATDAARNASAASEPVTFTVDTGVPDAPVLDTPADGSTTSDTTPTYTGTAEPLADVTVYEGTTVLGTGTADADGAFSITSTSLAEGPHTVVARAADAAGNTSADSAVTTFTVDLTAPTAPAITAPADGSVMADTTPAVAGTAEPGATVEVFVDGDSVGTTTADGDGAWSIDAPALDEGAHTATARATDPSGNVSATSEPVRFTVDTSAPAAPVVSTPRDGSTTSDPTPTISGTAEARSEVEVILDGASLGTVPVGADGTFLLTPTTPLADGPHTVTAVATDAAGNASPTSAAVTFTVDRSVAAPVLTAPADGSTTSDRTPTYTGTAEPLADVTIFEGADVVGTGQADETGAFSITSERLEEGPHRVVAQAVSGEVSTDSDVVGFTVDATAPDAPVVTTPADGSSTPDDTPTISGTAEPGATVDVTVDGDSIGTTTADGDGAWSLDAPALDQGEHTVTAVATDGAGNASTPSDPVTFTVDAVAPDAPVVTAPSDGSTVVDPTPSVSGTAEPRATVEVFVDGTSVGTDVADGEGGFAVTPTAPLADGPHTVTALATDPAGNVSPASVPVTFTVDATAPVAPVVTEPADGSTTTDTTPTVSGTAEPGAVVEVFVDGDSVGTTAADGTGAWSIDASELGQGAHVARAVATDAAGNVSEPSAAVTFSVDSEAPGAPVVTTPADGSTTTELTPAITGTAEPGSTVEVRVDGVAVGADTADEEGAFSVIPAAPLSEATHTVTAVATDPAGNASPASAPVTFTVDATAPAAPTVSAPADGSTIADRTPAITGTAEPGAGVEVFVDGAPVGTDTADEDGAYSVTPTAPLSEATHTVTAVATDPAGHASPASAPVSFTVDATAPTAPVITAPADGSPVTDTTPTISGRAEPDASVEVLVDGDSIGTVTADGTGAWSIDAPALDEGAHTATAVATDTAGNRSAESDEVRFTVDSVAPAVPVVTAPADGATVADTTPAVTGTAEPGATVDVLVDGTSVGTDVADEDGAFSVTPTTPLTEAEHSVTAVATDPAGNTSPASAPVAFTVDATAPAAPVVTAPANGATVADQTPTISGTAEPGVAVEVFVDGESIGIVQAGDDGAWTVDALELEQGAHTVTARATDAAGNVSDPSAEVGFTVDTVAPDAPVVTAPVDGGTVGDPTPTITGTAEPGSTVEVSVDGTPVGTDVADEDGSFSVTPTTPLADGDHTVSAVATDPAGNPSPASAPVTVTVDTTAPQPPAITTPADGSSTMDATPTISGTAEAGASVEVFVDGDSVGTVTADGTGAWSLDPAALDAGPHTATAVATDAAGNASAASAPVGFTVEADDTQAPAAPVISVPADGSTVADTTPVISGTAEAGSSVEVFLDGTSVGTAVADDDGAFAITPATPLTEGPHTATAVATDGAGNASPTSAADTFTVDTTAPAVPVVTTPADGSTTTDATPTISGTAEPGSAVEVFVDGQPTGTVTATDAGTWTVDASLLAPGRHTVAATATDAAGNASAESATNTFTVVAGTTPPPVITSPTEGSEVEGPDVSVCGTGTAGSTIVLTHLVDGEEETLGTTTVGEDGSWCVDADLPEGATSVSAVEVDPDGQVSAPTTVDFVVVPSDDGDGSDGSGNGGGGSSSGSGNGNGSSGGGNLASTGGPSLLVGIAALVLIAGGSATVVVSRRRRRQS